MNQEKIPAVGYVRCSTEMQEDSPGQQKKEILNFANAKGYTVLEWFEDFGKSGTTFDQRSGFQDLRKAVENKHSFKAVICYDESRWGRAIDAEENTFWRVHFRKNGVDVVLVKTSIDPRHEYAPMLKAFEGVQASQYSKKLSELTLRGAMNNGRFSSGGPAPYAYKRVAINQKTNAERPLDDGEWCIPGQEKVAWTLGEANEIEIVKDIFKLRVAGAGYGHIAARLNERGVPCPARGRWRNKNQRWSTITVKSMVNNPAYYGARAYNRNSMSKIRAEHEGWEARSEIHYPHWKQDKANWMVVESAHDPIVTKEQWLRANSVNQSAKPGQSKVKAPYLLSNLIVCKRCGFHFQGQTTGAKGHSYPRYICGGFNSKKVCSFVALRRDSLESFVVGCVQETLNNEQFLQRVRRHLENIVGGKNGKDANASSGYQRSLEDVDRRLSNIARAIEDGEEISLFRARLEELRKERTKLEQRLGAVKLEGLKKEKLEQLVLDLSNFRDRFLNSFAQAPLQEKKQLLRMCVARIEVAHDPRTVNCFVRQVPSIDGSVEELLESDKKDKQAALGSGLPVVSVGVAGAGLEPATFGL